MCVCAQQAPEASTEDESPEQPASFVDSILKAITHEEEQQPSSKTSADTGATPAITVALERLCCVSITSDSI